ncbi:MAG: T9SS type A sorting domain-containing protein, partial [Bacteroidota bacterium]
LGCITGITYNENPNVNFLVYPNPVEEMFSISGLENNMKYEIEVYSSSGQKIMHRNDFSAKDQVDCSGFSAGIYLVLIDRKWMSKISISE